MNTIGRPRKEDTKTIKVSINSEMANALEDIAEKTGKKQYDVLREIIPIISSKSFEEMIPTTSMNLLIQYSENCWNILHNPACIFDVETFSATMPAFISELEGTPTVYVKYPTYKIQIYKQNDPTKLVDTAILEELLCDVPGRSLVYATKADYMLVDGAKVSENFSFISEVTCLGTTLETITNCKECICSILKNNSYGFTVYPTWCTRKEEIIYLEEKKYFKVSSTTK